MYFSDVNNSLETKTSTRPCFRGLADGHIIIKKPIEQVENVIDKTVDTFIKPDNEDKKKKSYRTAVTVGSGVFVLSTLVALLNPKFSGKLLEKVKNLSQKIQNKTKIEKGSKGDFYSILQTMLKGPEKFLQFMTNSISLKDTVFKWFCVDKKEFTFLEKKHKTLQNICKKVDSGVRKVLAKPHIKITESFDKISKYTVVNRYRELSKDLSSFNNLIESYQNKFPRDVQIKINEKLKEIAGKQEYFAKPNVQARLKQQEVLMSDLESLTRDKIKDYIYGYKNPGRGEHFKNNLSLWAKDIIQPQQDKLEKDGMNFVSSLIGSNNGKKGAYNEIYELMEPYLNDIEKKSFDNMIKKTEKKLIKANQIENIEYFDKKRDLILGSAPTDILTAIVGLGASGIAISTADSKEDRISRAITVGIPAIAGFGVNLIMTALLVSGPLSLITALGSSYLLNRLGIKINKAVFPESKFAQNDIDNKNKKNKKSEVLYA